MGLCPGGSKTQLGAQSSDLGWDEPETPQQVWKWSLWSHFSVADMCNQWW